MYLVAKITFVLNTADVLSIEQCYRWTVGKISTVPLPTLLTSFLSI